MVAPDEMVGVPAHVLARLVLRVAMTTDEASIPEAMQNAIHDALVALDLGPDIKFGDLARLVAA